MVYLFTQNHGLSRLLPDD